VSVNESYTISAKELKTILTKNPSSVFLLDVREPEEFEESRIEGCTLIPLGELSQRAEKELKRDDDIIVYCAHGVRSMHALMGLKQMGFEKVRSLEGGIVDFLEQRV
jgi:sulfur-carrier protein adenylyltransferase/sulfurtransferase